ncbi:hypothetical protein H8356DRAFT_1269392 [Neocallimastix lanati (nom. inval.)]|jgi:hypothetical protein|uniref:RGS domain-containing protein n=1 Tax=Neocallimastix californiae TaxID=1754190 RepID=A0A1Y2F9R6_9FUNG|nr:hypothetical protein H8356DRAFT_1269392 [Neocallimastix sp. JGI-2020a]ORY79625.1 hypothetical protein LY90DRAFT_500641 [Neocallimastix californiae]|eukprot:ORY79625.1 hypothetical protein LY90DRAFT_500641 [Neocallimastix californiae]
MSTPVNITSSTEEINNYYCTFKDSKYKFYNYVNDKYDGTVGIFIGLETKSGKMYCVLEILLLIYYFVPLLWIIKYKDWYIFKQRNFVLTFIGGIANFLSTFSNSSTNIMRLPCSLTYYSATIATFIMQACYVFRAFRLILLYKLNIFKVTTLNKNKFTKKAEKNSGLVEPNIYFKSIYRLVNKKLTKILIPLLVFLVSLISVGFHIKANMDHKGFGTICGFSLVDINARINSEMYGKCYMDKLAKNSTLVADIKRENVSTFSYMRTMYRIPEVLTILFTTICLVIAGTFAFSEINDDQKFGYKFDCFSSAIISILIGFLYFYFKFEMKDIITLDEKEMKRSLTSKHQIYLRTKQAILFFVIIGIYIQLTSVIIPLVQCIKIERINKKRTNDSMNTIEFFYRVLKHPSLVEELKTVAVQEFSVENVLFWENYCTLHKLVSRTMHHLGEAEADSRGTEYYSLFSLQDMMYSNSHSGSLSSSNLDEESFDPNLPILPPLLPYYQTFYNTFISIEGPAPVNITADIIGRINHEFNNLPTLGVFDEAKNEVVDSMFFSIYPIFLQRNRNQLGKIITENNILK